MSNVTRFVGTALAAVAIATAVAPAAGAATVTPKAGTTAVTKVGPEHRCHFRLFHHHRRCI